MLVQRDQLYGAFPSFNIPWQPLHGWDNGSFTLATFASKTTSDSNRRCHLTLFALAALGGTTQIGSFLLAKGSE